MQTQMTAMLQESLNFVRQVEINRVIEGVYPISKLVRLSESLQSNDGNITATVEFGNSVGFACLKGKVSAALMVECQRCLQPMEIEVSGSFKFALVNSEDEFELLPDEFEPYILEGEEQSIIDLIEDELLLCLPMVSAHEQDCSDFMTNQNEKVKAVMQDEREAEKEATHPFASLKALKGDKVN